MSWSSHFIGEWYLGATEVCCPGPRSHIFCSRTNHLLYSFEVKDVSFFDSSWQPNLRPQKNNPFFTWRNQLEQCQVPVQGSLAADLLALFPCTEIDEFSLGAWTCLDLVDGLLFCAELSILGSYLCGGCFCLFACFPTVGFKVSILFPLEGFWFLVAVFVFIGVVFIPLRAFWVLFGLSLFCLLVEHVIYYHLTFVS